MNPELIQKYIKRGMADGRITYTLGEHPEQYIQVVWMEDVYDKTYLAMGMDFLEYYEMFNLWSAGVMLGYESEQLTQEQ